MPEGPSIVIVKNALSGFIGRKVLSAAGNAKIDLSLFEGQRLEEIRTWGKHLLLRFPTFTIRIHFLMFGTYLVNERKKTPLRLSLRFAKEEINFYTCAVKVLDGDLDAAYDWSADIMGDRWSARKASAKLALIPSMMVCDALMDQDIFSGVGNIIKNEVLFRIAVHPGTLIKNLPPAKRRAMLSEARRYSFEFLEWKQKNTLKAHWKIYHKKTCPRDGTKVTKAELGVKKRASFFCRTCQIKYRLG